MRRREFITLLGGGAAIWPLAARAQQADHVQRIGVLMAYPEDDSEALAQFTAFRDGLQKLGWIEGRNIRIDTRWVTPDNVELMRQFAKELVALQPNVILSHTTLTTAALLQQTRIIPIIFANVSDPVGSGSYRLEVELTSRACVCHRPIRRLRQSCRGLTWPASPACPNLHSLFAAPLSRGAAFPLLSTRFRALAVFGRRSRSVR